MDNMEIMTLVSQIFEVCIIPLLGILTGFLVKYLNKKSQEITDNTDNALLNKYIKMLTETITDCVIATNQTYVNNLKQQGKFDAEAQKEAFKQTYNAVLEILSDDAKVYLSNAFGDLEIYLTQRIEAVVNQNRTSAEELISTTTE